MRQHDAALNIFEAYGKVTYRKSVVGIWTINTAGLLTQRDFTQGTLIGVCDSKVLLMRQRGGSSEP